MGGDEFTAILTGLRNGGGGRGYARELLAALRTPCRVNGRELFVTASLGISCFRETDSMPRPCFAMPIGNVHREESAVETNYTSSRRKAARGPGTAGT